MANLECNAVSAVQLTHLLLGRMRAKKLRGCFVYTSSGGQLAQVVSAAPSPVISDITRLTLAGPWRSDSHLAPGLLSCPMTAVPPSLLSAAAAMIPNPFSVLYASTKSFLSCEWPGSIHCPPVPLAWAGSVLQCSKLRPGHVPTPCAPDSASSEPQHNYIDVFAIDWLCPDSVAAFGASLAAEVRPYGIDVLVFHPSPVATRFYDKVDACTACTARTGTLDLPASTVCRCGVPFQCPPAHATK
jgi:short-subunit dehydrogenase